jgi:PAS domain S-box-containing protein
LEDTIRILIVDDDLDRLSANSRILKSAEYEVLEAKTGAEALEKLKAERLDMVLLDVVLPDMNGVDLCKRIRSDSNLSRLQVILLSSRKTKTKHQVEDLEFGADGHIPRGISERSLLARIASTARIITAERKVRESEERYRLLLQNANDAVYVHAISPEGPGKFLEVNDRACQMLGYSREEFLAMDIPQIDIPEQAQRVPAIIRQLLETGQAVFETEHKAKKGHRIPVEVSTRLFQLHNVPTVLSIIRDISDRKRAERKVRESEEKYRILVENASDIVYRTDALGHITFFNPAAMKITGHAEADLIGKHFSELIRPDCRAEAERFYGRQFVKNIHSTYYEFPLLTRDKGEIWLGQHVQLIIHEGQVIGFHAIARDITALNRVEVALRESEERYRTILDEMEEGYQEADLAGNFTFFNEAFLRIFGYSKDELMGTNFSLYAAEEEIAKKVYRAYNLMYKTAIPIRSFEWDIIRKDGARRTLEFFASLLRDSNDRPTGFRGIVRDVTERKWAEEKLRNSESRYHFLAESMADVVFTLDLNLVTTYVSPSIERMLGSTPEERMAQKVDQQLTPTSLKLVFETLVAELDREKDKNADLNRSQTLELEYYHKDGSIKYLVTYIRGIRNSEGQLTGFYGAHHDITDRKRVEDALRESEGKYRQLATTTHDVIVTMDFEGIITYANPAAKNLAGGMDIIGMSIKDFIPPELISKHIELINARRQGYSETLSYEWPITLSADGSILFLETRSALLMDKSKPTGILFTARDITERKHADDALKKSFAQTRRALGATVRAMAVTVEARDPYTAGHQRRVADLARAIATEMNLSSDQIDGIRTASVIHDLGKISVPAEILSKPIRLKDIEFSLIKTHAQSGYDILKEIEFPWPIARMVFEHHERMNGSGYPNGLTGDKLLIESRILAVADVVEAMASHRPYRPSHGVGAALDEIAQNKGTLYDPEVVDACLRLFKTKSYKIPE